VFLILFLTFIFFILSSVVFYSWLYGISPTPSSLKVRKILLNSIPNIPEGIILELGSGWGGLACELAKQFPQCQIYAYEISPIPWFISKVRGFFLKIKNLHIKREDFFDLSFESCSMVVCYLYSGAMQKLKDKFEKELTPGTWIVTHTFAVPGWIPYKKNFS